MAKLKTKQNKSRCLSAFKVEEFRMPYPGTQKVFLSLSICVSLCSLPLFLFCVLASLSLLELDSPHTAGQIISGNPRPVFFFSSAKLQDSYWLSLSHMFCPEPIIVCQWMWNCDWQRLSHGLWALVVGQGIIDIPNRVWGNEGWDTERNLEKTNEKVCWPVHCRLLECLLKSCLHDFLYDFSQIASLL